MTRALFTASPAPGGNGAVRLRLAVGGHAGYAPKGQDIVCAAASILVESLADALKADASDELAVDAVWERSLVILTADCAPTRYPRVRGLFDTALAGYRLLAQHYPEYLQFRAAEETESCRK